ncbi:MAG: hypothetical protein ACC682_01235 [Gemmatimonadota bacterium]
MRRSMIAGISVLAAGLVACSEPTAVACTLEFRYGLSIAVLDGSGTPAAEGAFGLAVEGSFVDTMMVFSPETLVGAGERAGTYDITITKEGFMTWTAENITVTADECHVIPVSLDANLIPVP